MEQAVGPTRKTRILDSCKSGGLQAFWLADWLDEDGRFEGIAKLGRLSRIARIEGK